MSTRQTAKMLTILVLALSLMVCSAKLSGQTPMGTAITYQGRLIDANEPADGDYDFTFTLYDEAAGGNQEGNTIDVNEQYVIDGYFRVELDFGSGVFDGNSIWLEIDVRPGDSNDPNDFVTLSPRQEITPVPYALQTRGIYVGPNGNVGIGTTSPIEKLHVNGDLKVNNIELGHGDILDNDSVRIVIDRNNDQTNQTFTVLRDGTAGPELFRIQENGNVGIGTTTPSERLHIQGNVRIVDGNQAAGSILTSNANGVASWQNSPTGALPQGVIVMWWGLINNIPNGWALCDGGTYQAPNGGQVTTPDLRDRFIVGARQDMGGDAMTNVKGSLMQTGGAHEHTLTIAEMPAHTHTGRFSDQRDDSDGDDTQYYVNKGATGVSGSRGGNQPHENCPPFYALYFIMHL